MLTLGITIAATNLSINSVIMLERVKVLIAIVMTRGDSPLSYIKIKFCYFSFGHNRLINNVIQLSMTAIWKIFSQYIFFYKYMVMKICALKYFEQCILINKFNKADPFVRYTLFSYYCPPLYMGSALGSIIA